MGIWSGMQHTEDGIPMQSPWRMGLVMQWSWGARGSGVDMVL